MDVAGLKEIRQKIMNLSNDAEDNKGYEEIVSRLTRYIENTEEQEKSKQKELSELALNYWRLSNWINNSNCDRKTVANSALKKIKGYLDKNEIELIDLTGRLYDDGYAADVMGIESERDVPEDEMIVREMVKPIIMYKGSVAKHGQVVLGDEIKVVEEIQADQFPEEPEKGIALIQKDIDGYCGSKYKEKGIVRKLRWCKEKLDKWLNARRNKG